jgi:hypothetical protein
MNTGCHAPQMRSPTSTMKVRGTYPVPIFIIHYSEFYIQFTGISAPEAHPPLAENTDQGM